MLQMRHTITVVTIVTVIYQQRGLRYPLLLSIEGKMYLSLNTVTTYLWLDHLGNISNLRVILLFICKRSQCEILQCFALSQFLSWELLENTQLIIRVALCLVS